MKLKFLDKRRRAYRAAFEGPEGEQVLRDLARFCHAAPGKTTFVLDDPSGRASAYKQGARDVFGRIQAYLNLTDQDIAKLAEGTDE